MANPINLKVVPPVNVNVTRTTLLETEASSSTADELVLTAAVVLLDKAATMDGNGMVSVYVSLVCLFEGKSKEQDCV